MPRKQATTLSEIAEAALNHISRHGFKQTQMSDIAKATGTSAGTLYLYVENKEALLALTSSFLLNPAELEASPLPFKAPGNLVSGQAGLRASGICPSSTHLRPWSHIGAADRSVGGDREIIHSAPRPSCNGQSRHRNPRLVSYAPTPRRAGCTTYGQIVGRVHPRSGRSGFLRHPPGSTQIKETRHPETAGFITPLGKTQPLV